MVDVTRIPAGLPFSAFLKQQGVKAPAGPHPLLLAPLPIHLGSARLFRLQRLLPIPLPFGTHSGKRRHSHAHDTLGKNKVPIAHRSSCPQWLYGWHSGALTIFQG